MNCKKMRTQFSSFAASDLEGRTAEKVADHLKQCPDCQTGLEKTRKLRALLSLKRHEQPNEFFFRTYLAGFHRRLHADMLRRRTFRDALRDVFESAVRPAWILRATLPIAAVLLVLVGVYFWHTSEENHRVRQALQNQPVSRPIMTASNTGSAGVRSVWKEMVNANPSDPNVVYVLDRLANHSAAHELVIFTF